MGFPYLTGAKPLGKWGMSKRIPMRPEGRLRAARNERRREKMTTVAIAAMYILIISLTAIHTWRSG